MTTSEKLADALNDLVEQRVNGEYVIHIIERFIEDKIEEAISELKGIA